ncbi:NAD(P)H-hydrate dehydratase [Psychrobacter sp. 72-O-c]|uniref:NAD(P)H-hydrate dehydratase n=1 Tax=Psychrobacter sp. 72-O-c TaxID=2774125 RepID=UPI00191A289C|nr:NAD(P)H-hydrate dehydratase [Psychrobacter sp. 72-O-c]
MQAQSTLLLSETTRPIALYSSEQLYAMEQAWFAQGHDSFGLMQQVAWQMAQYIEQLHARKYRFSHLSGTSPTQQSNNRQRRVSIWVGQGNNGGDGWLIAYYLQQAGWQVQVITVGFDKDDFNKSSFDKNNKTEQASVSDAKKAQQLALSANCPYQRFEDSNYNQNDHKDAALQADVYVDALFGIGLDRALEGVYEQAINTFNCVTKQDKSSETLVVAVDIPSGLVASTGQVFEQIAIQADVTLCLIARKFGLHTKDGMDYSGEVLDIPLIPYQTTNQALMPVATLLNTAHKLSARRQNSYKGSYGHVLIIGGNRIDGSQGMGGAAILSASSAMATGAGKITVACHEAFHGALLTSLPDAMTINLHDEDGVKQLIEDASIVAIGMGLGRDKKAKALFVSYIQAAIVQGKPLVIDADGLYHLASLQVENHELVTQLRKYSTEHQVCLTPHSGEAARLLDKKISEVEDDRLAAIKKCATTYGGDWVLKGAGSLVLEQVLEQPQVYICSTGNAGMATAGMGDVLSGVTAGLLAQQDLKDESHGLHQAVLIHGLAGDALVNQPIRHGDDHVSLLIGQRGLQAQDMPAAIRHVMQLITD